MWSGKILFFSIALLSSLAFGEHSGSTPGSNRSFGDVYSGNNLYSTPSVCGPRVDLANNSLSSGVGNFIPQPSVIAPTPTENKNTASGKLAAGKQVFETKCLTCHANTKLPSPFGEAGIVAVQGGKMPKAPTVLTPEEKANLIAFLGEKG